MIVHYVMHDCGILEESHFWSVVLLTPMYPVKYAATFISVLESYEFPEALQLNKQHAI